MPFTPLLAVCAPSVRVYEYFGSDLQNQWAMGRSAQRFSGWAQVESNKGTSKLCFLGGSFAADCLMFLPELDFLQSSNSWVSVAQASHLSGVRLKSRLSLACRPVPYLFSWFSSWVSIWITKPLAGDLRTVA